MHMLVFYFEIAAMLLIVDETYDLVRITKAKGRPRSLKLCYRTSRGQGNRCQRQRELFFTHFVFPYLCAFALLLIDLKLCTRARFVVSFRCCILITFTLTGTV